MTNAILESGTVYTDGFLKHHGVKGMKWGVRKERSSGGASGKAVVDRALEKRGSTKVGDPTLVIYPAMALTILAAKGYGTLSDSGYFSQKRQNLKGADAAWAKNPAFAKKSPTESDIKTIATGINPDFPGPGTISNCRRATMAYELRRRGYDVKATKTIAASGQHDVGLVQALDPKAPKMALSQASVNRRLTRDAHNKSSKRYNTLDEVNKRSTTKHYTNEATADAKMGELTKTIDKLPNGARGELTMYFGQGGHSIAFEKSGKNTFFVDAQSNSVMTRDHATMRDFMEASTTVRVTRLDNQQMNPQFLTRWVK